MEPAALSAKGLDNSDAGGAGGDIEVEVGEGGGQDFAELKNEFAQRVGEAVEEETGRIFLTFGNEVVMAGREVGGEGGFQMKRKRFVVEAGVAAEDKAGETPEHGANAVQLAAGAFEVDAETGVDVFVEVFEEFAADFGKAGLDGFVEFGAEGLESAGDVFGVAALLVDIEDLAFEVDAGFDSAEDIVGSAKYAAEEVEFLFEEFMNAAVGLIFLVEEVDDNDVMFLAIPVAASDALFNALGVPGEVVVDDERAELEVDAFGGGFGGDEDLAIVAEVFKDGGADIDQSGTRGAAGGLVGFEPALEDGGGEGVGVGPVKSDDTAGMAIGFEELFEVGLGAARLGEDDGAAGGAHFSHVGEADFESGEQGAAFGVDADAASPLGVSAEFVDLQFELVEIENGFGWGIGLRIAGFGGIAIDEFVEEVVLEFLILDQPADKVAGGEVRVAQVDQAGAHGLEGGGDGEGGRGKEFADDKGGEVALLIREGVGIGALEEGGDCLVEFVFLFGGLEGTGDEATFGVLDVLTDLAAKGALQKELRRRLSSSRSPPTLTKRERKEGTSPKMCSSRNVAMP